MLTVTTTCGSWATARVWWDLQLPAWMKVVIGDLLNLSTVGDDAWITYGRAVSVIMHAAVAGNGLDQVPFLLNSPKDIALAS